MQCAISGKFQGVPAAYARAFMRTLANLGEVWRTHNTIFTTTSVTFTKVPAKVAHIHQSSGEGAFCMWVAFRMCPIIEILVTSFRMRAKGGKPRKVPRSTFEEASMLLRRSPSLRSRGQKDLLRTPPLLLRRCCVELFMVCPFLLSSYLCVPL